MQLLSVSFFLDTLQLFPDVAETLYKNSLLPPTNTISALSHYAGAAGLLAALPTLATGIAELYGMWRGNVQDVSTVSEAAKSTANAPRKNNIGGEKLRTTLTHASINDLVVGIAAYNWSVPTSGFC